MRPVKLCHPSTARTILSEQDAARLRRAGWLEVTNSEPPSYNATTQRRFRERRKKLGMRQLLCWLPEEVFTALMREKTSDESISDLMLRVIKSFLSHKII